MKKKWLIIAGVLSLSLIAYATVKVEEKACFAPNVPVPSERWSFPADKKELKVLILGDTGMGNSIQYRVAESSAVTCKERGCDMGVLLGDNFYDNGVTSVDDEQFRYKFDEAYPQKMPFFPVLGNHDFKGNWKAQIEYSRRNPRWVMPGANYYFSAGPVFFQAINTSCLPASINYLNRNTSHSWNILLGHFPFITSGRRGSMWYVPKRFIKKAGFDFFFAGHDHFLEHLEKKYLTQIISGGGGGYLQRKRKKKKLSKHSRFFARSHGYAWGRFTTEEAQIIFFDQNGNYLYDFTKTRQD